MHLFGDAELEQGLRPQAEVGAARRLKIAGQDAFELFNLAAMEKRHLPSFLSPFPSLPLSLSLSLFPRPLCAVSTIPSLGGNDKPNIPEPSFRQLALL